MGAVGTPVYPSRRARIPNYSTLKKFSDRIVSADLIDSLLGQILTLLADPASEVAIDSTGMDSNIHILPIRGDLGLEFPPEMIYRIEFRALFGQRRSMMFSSLANCLVFAASWLPC